MKLSRIQEILEAKVIAGNGDLEGTVEYGYGCDLMSDVLAYVQNDVVLLTGLNALERFPIGLMCQS